MPLTPPFPFIVGSARSGTTLLRALLDSHPALAIPPESYFVVTLARRAERYLTAGGFDGELFCSDVAAHPRFKRWGLAEEAMRAVVAERAPADFAEAMRAVYSAYARAHDKPRYADKTPKYVKDIGRLEQLFPEARFVHILRDGRDVVLSFKDLAWGPTSAIEGALRWRAWVEQGREAGRALGEARYLEVGYENLADDPEPVLRKICEFLELDFDPAMFGYTARAEELIAPNYHPEGHARIRMAPTTGLRSWRESMTREDLVKFELIAGDVLSDLGYERAVPEATVKRPRERDDEQLEGAPAAETGADVDLGDELPALIGEVNFLRRRVRRLSRRIVKQRKRSERRGARRERQAERQHQRKLERVQRRRQVAVRRRKKVERTLAELEATRWWRLRLRFLALLGPLTAYRARRRLR